MILWLCASVGHLCYPPLMAATSYLLGGRGFFAPGFWLWNMTHIISLGDRDELVAGKRHHRKHSLRDVVHRNINGQMHTVATTSMVVHSTYIDFLL